MTPLPQIFDLDHAQWHQLIQYRQSLGVDLYGDLTREEAEALGWVKKPEDPNDIYMKATRNLCR